VTYAPVGFFLADAGPRPADRTEVPSGDVEAWLLEREFDTRHGPTTWSGLRDNIASEAKGALTQQLSLRNWAALGSAERDLEKVLTECDWPSGLPEDYFDEVVGDLQIVLWTELLVAAPPEVKTMASGIEWAYRSGLLPCGWPNFPAGSICAWDFHSA